VVLRDNTNVILKEESAYSAIKEIQIVILLTNAKAHASLTKNAQHRSKNAYLVIIQMIQAVKKHHIAMMLIAKIQALLHQTNSNVTAQLVHVINVLMENKDVDLKRTARITARHQHHQINTNVIVQQDLVINAQMETQVVFLKGIARIAVHRLLHLQEIINATKIQELVTNAHQMTKIVFLKMNAQTIVKTQMDLTNVIQISINVCNALKMPPKIAFKKVNAKQLVVRRDNTNVTLKEESAFSAMMEIKIVNHSIAVKVHVSPTRNAQHLNKNVSRVIHQMIQAVKRHLTAMTLTARILVQHHQISLNAIAQRERVINAPMETQIV
jgi:hypothetical protein